MYTIGVFFAIQLRTICFTWNYIFASVKIDFIYVNVLLFFDFDIVIIVWCLYGPSSINYSSRLVSAYFAYFAYLSSTFD